ncbi:MaoC/PaaZ C-terminal domain-containing protein [Roseibium sp.]|uniref:MaoC/PaaZ C-terminal domain-containing protein n=1 Tax=Roseibium sp. TaxID=1936156 RepID=UPI003B52B8C1
MAGLWFEEFAAFEKPLAKSLMTLGTMIRMSVNETTLGTTFAYLGMSNVTFPAPVFQGDTLRIRTTVESCRESGSPPEAGIVNLLHEARRQNGFLSNSRKRAARVRRRTAA